MHQIQVNVWSNDIGLRLESIYKSEEPTREAILIKQLALHRMNEEEDYANTFVNYVKL